MKIHELHYSNTNTYLIEGTSGKLLFDTGWAGTFQAFCRAMGELQIPVQEIDFLLISHYHPDHMGIAQEIARQGAVILAADVQRDFIHAADAVFEKEKGTHFVPIREEAVRFFPVQEGRSILKEIGLEGEILHTPGHSDDSISLYLDEGAVLVGDLNPLYELEMHRGTQIEESWKRVLALRPNMVYYGHARTVAVGSELWAWAQGVSESRDAGRSGMTQGAGGQDAPKNGDAGQNGGQQGAGRQDAPKNGDAGQNGGQQGVGGQDAPKNGDAGQNGGQQGVGECAASKKGRGWFGLGKGRENFPSDGGYGLVAEIMKMIDKGFDRERIQKKTGADAGLIEDVMRMYLTHPGVSVQGILDRIEIRNR